MRWTKISLLVMSICSVLISQIGCGRDDGGVEHTFVEKSSADEEFSTVEKTSADEEFSTQQELYEFADRSTRWKKSRAARKKYIKLRETRPNEALKAYIEYYNWMYYGHPLAEKIARISARMDMAGETTIPDMLQLLNLKLEMIKDLKLTTKAHIAELEADIRFWNELGAELVANGRELTDCKIEYEISENGS